jgi:hypothetical protein
MIRASLKSLEQLEGRPDHALEPRAFAHYALDVEVWV